MDYSNALGVEYQEVKDATRDGQPARVVGGARTYATDIDDLWDALTNIKRIPRWFLPITGDLKLGGRYQLHGNAGGEITRCNPPEALDVTWEFADNVSWVTVRLEPDGNGARLTLEHTMPKFPKRRLKRNLFWTGAKCRAYCLLYLFNDLGKLTGICIRLDGAWRLSLPIVA